MEARLAKALHTAATTALKPDNGVWAVPSQSGLSTYRVAIASDLAWRCNCPDFEEFQSPCKHGQAVEITIARESGGDSTEYSDPAKATYPQDWAAHNAAQISERDRVLDTLADLCGEIPEPEVAATGRPRLPLSDVVFSVVYKVFRGDSSRRFMCDLNDAIHRGHITKAPSFNSLLRYLGTEDLTPVLSDLIELSALPLAEIDSHFAADSTGFGASKMGTWFSTKHGREITERDWRKLHAMAGVKTHVITSAIVTGPTSNDCPHLPELVLCPQTFVGSRPPLGVLGLF